MRITKEHVSNGAVLELGDVRDVDTEQARGGGLRVVIAHSGETEKYALVRFDAAGGTDVDVPEGSHVLSVESGRGMIDASLWVLIPFSEYNTE